MADKSTSYAMRETVDGDGVKRRPGYWADKCVENVNKMLKDYYERKSRCR